jgi:bacteriorhodopsin
MENYVFSFYLTYILLLTTATITLIEALRTKIPAVQHIMNLETCISFVAGYFYSVFNDKIKTCHANKEAIKWKEITQLRYIDWAITTPIMLLVLSLVLSFNSKTKIRLHWFLVSIFFNYVMLYTGYLGETGKLERMMSQILGFIAFIITFGVIFIQYLLPRFNFDNMIIFWSFVVVWGLYGVAFNLNELDKNITYNYLDLISKCFIGIGLWIYYIKIIKFV